MCMKTDGYAVWMIQKCVEWRRNIQIFRVSGEMAEVAKAEGLFMDLSLFSLLVLIAVIVAAYITKLNIGLLALAVAILLSRFGGIKDSAMYGGINLNVFWTLIGIYFFWSVYDSVRNVIIIC